MTFPRMRALWLMIRGQIVQPDPVERREGDTHSRKVGAAFGDMLRAQRAIEEANNEVGDIRSWGRCMEPMSPQWEMAGQCLEVGRPDLAAEWAIVALTGTARTVEEEA